ncbi:MAG: Sua5/YciO/YrdC/YwlC family protein, partial [Victivallaceae bacterium]
NTRKLVDTGLILTPSIEILAKKFCPGPITLIGKNKAGETIGFRVPDNDFVQEILHEINFPLASTSANRSGEPNALSAEAALNQLNGEVDLAFDGGNLPADAQASTVVLVDDSEVRILRPGPISQEAVAAALLQN